MIEDGGAGGISYTMHSCKVQFEKGESSFLGIHRGRDVFLKNFFGESSEPLRTIQDLLNYVSIREKHCQEMRNHYSPKEYSQGISICRNAREALLDIIESQ